jgi:hypothetical protein
VTYHYNILTDSLTDCTISQFPALTASHLLLHTHLCYTTSWTQLRLSHTRTVQTTFIGENACWEGSRQFLGNCGCHQDLDHSRRVSQSFDEITDAHGLACNPLPTFTLGDWPLFKASRYRASLSRCTTLFNTSASCCIESSLFVVPTSVYNATIC